MAITTFDTLKYVRKLEEAGVPAQQAEAQAEVLTEAFNVNLDALVTKDYLAARFAEQNASIDARFAEQNASIDTRFAEQNTSIDARFAEQNASIDVRFAEQNASIDTRFAEQKSYTDTKFEQVNARFAEQDAKIDANFRILAWMLGIVQAFVILPYLERFL